MALSGADLVLISDLMSKIVNMRTHIAIDTGLADRAIADIYLY